MKRIWMIGQMDGGDVRLRNGQGSGVLSLDVTAPVRAGSLRAQATRMHLDLTIALDQIKIEFVRNALNMHDGELPHRTCSARVHRWVSGARLDLRGEWALAE